MFKKNLLPVSVVFIVTFVFIVAMRWLLSDWQRAELSALDRLRPETFKYLTSLNPTVGQLKMYGVYFQKVSALTKGAFAESFSLEGYVAYKQGDLRRAEELYKKALKFKQQFFPYAYNLGVLSFLKGDYQGALIYWQEAIKMDLNTSISNIAQSGKIYAPIVVDCYVDINGVARSLMGAYQDLPKFLLLAQMRLSGDHSVDIKPELLFF